MKNRINISLVTLLFFTLGCEDESTKNVSFVTSYPVITFTGNSVIAHPVGTPFTDPGAVAFAGEDIADLVVEGAVTDINTIGAVFKISYTATNKDGFSRTRTREIVIVDPETNSLDLSGRYIRNATGVEVEVTKVGPSVYYHTNVGGFAGATLDAYFVHVQGTQLIIPLQVASVSGIEVESRPGTAFTNASGFQWAINAAGFGTGNRFWVKL
jgi:hypothetical protein